MVLAAVAAVSDELETEVLHQGSWWLLEEKIVEWGIVEGRSVGTARSKVLDMGWHVVGCR